MLFINGSGFVLVSVLGSVFAMDCILVVVYFFIGCWLLLVHFFFLGCGDFYGATRRLDS
jgi:hypothetical protein